jgi:hypothetical protein
MSGFELLVISMNLIVAGALFAFYRRRDCDILHAVRLAEIWRQPLNSYPMQRPAQN